MRYPPYIEADFTFPDFYHVQLRAESDGIADVAAATAATVDRALANSSIRSGDTVAVAKRDGTLETTRVTKLFVFDDRYVVLGSMGIGDNHHTDWVDVMVEVDGAERGGDGAALGGGGVDGAAGDHGRL